MPIVNFPNMQQSNELQSWSSSVSTLVRDMKKDVFSLGEDTVGGGRGKSSFMRKNTPTNYANKRSIRTPQKA